MHFSEDIIQHKLSAALAGLKHLKTSKIGLVHGLLKVKECITAANQCKDQERILLIQQLLIQVALNYQFHQMFSKKLEPNGLKLCPIWIAPQIRLSAM